MLKKHLEWRHSFGADTILSDFSFPEMTQVLRRTSEGGAGGSRGAASHWGSWAMGAGSMTTTCMHGLS